MKKIFKTLCMILVIGALIAKTVSVINSPVNSSDEVFEKIPTENVCVILNYHRVRNENLWEKFMKKVLRPEELTNYSVTTEIFKNQIEYLIDNDVYFATLDEFEKFREEGSFPDKCVLLSFDDADETTYKIAYPYLKEKNIPFVVNVIAGQVGNKDFNNLELATWDELREMRDSGLVSFGSHTYDMHYLVDNKAVFLQPEESENFLEDIKQSKSVLESELGVEIKSITYPFGITSDLVTEKAKEAGFKEAFILAPHPVTLENDSYYLDRYLITESNFNLIVNPWIESIKATGK